MQTSVSARKLATALWEMNRISSPQVIENLPEKMSMKVTRGRGRMARSIQPSSLPRHLFDPSHSPVSDISDRSRSGSHRRIMPLIYQKSRYNEHNHKASDLPSNPSLMETKTHSQVLTLTSSVMGTKSRLKDLSNGLMTSKELLKMLLHIWGHGDQHSSTIALVSALRAELDRARVLVDQFIREQRSDFSEISCLRKQLLEEKSARKSKEQERIRAAVQSLMEELESEKKRRRRAERMNKKLGMEVSHMKTSLSMAAKELESERRSSEIIEQICNELVRGIGEDKAVIEELKREYVKVREELEEEREMLHHADEWREERVQMKLSEAKFQFEEKNAAVDQLRNELEAFLAAKRTEEHGNTHEDVVSHLDCQDQSQLLFPSRNHRAANLIVDGRKEVGEEGQEEDHEVDSEGSDLHSIELNMDGNNKSYIWSYATAASEDETKISVLERKHKTMSANCERVPRSSFSLDTGAIEGTKRNFSNKFQHLGVELDQEKLCDNSSLLDKQTLVVDQDAKRYLSVNGHRDHMLANSRIAVPQGLVSPTRQWSRAQAFEDMGDQTCEGSKVDEMVKAIRESELKGKTRRNKSKAVHSLLQMAPTQ